MDISTPSSSSSSVPKETNFETDQTRWLVTCRNWQATSNGSTTFNLADQLMRFKWTLSTTPSCKEDFISSQAKQLSAITQLFDLASTTTPLAKFEFIDKWIAKQVARYEDYDFESHDHSLDSIEDRFGWFINWLSNYNAHPLPASWNVPKLFALKFCGMVASWVTQCLQGEFGLPKEINVESLVKSLHACVRFENTLVNYFSADLDDITPLPPSTSRSPMTTHSFELDTASIVAEMCANTQSTKSNDDWVVAGKIQGVISKCFKHHMYLFEDQQKALLAKKFDEFITDETWTVDKDSRLKVFLSARLLFQEMERMCDYASVLCRPGSFKRVCFSLMWQLHGYADQLKARFASLTSSTVSTERSDKVDLCLLIKTADYCKVEINKLEKRIVARLPPKYKIAFDLVREEEMFTSLLGSVFTHLASQIDLDLIPAFSSMVAINWNADGCTTNPLIPASPYVYLIKDCIGTCLPVLNDYLACGPNPTNTSDYFGAICQAILLMVAARFEKQVCACKQISEFGGHQLTTDWSAIYQILIVMSYGMYDVGINSTSYTYTEMLHYEYKRVDHLLSIIRTPIATLVTATSLRGFSVIPKL